MPTDRRLTDACTRKIHRPYPGITNAGIPQFPGYPASHAAMGDFDPHPLVAFAVPVFSLPAPSLLRRGDAQQSIFSLVITLRFLVALLRRHSHVP